MSQPGQQPRIVGDWTPVDNSNNRLELALTDQLTHGHNGQEQVVAMRDTFNPSQVIYVTPGQCRTFGKAINTENSKASQILASAASGTTGR